MAAAHVTHALCISVKLPDWPAVHALATGHRNLYATAGVHPDYEDTPEPTVETLVALAARPKVVALGETGLDYYRLEGDLELAARAVPHPHPGGARGRQAARHSHPVGGRRHTAHHARGARRRGRRRDALLHRELGGGGGGT